MLMCDFELARTNRPLRLPLALLRGGQAYNEPNLSVIRPEPREFQSITISVG